MPASDDVTRYIEKLPSPQKEICQAIRDMVVRTFPGLREGFKWSRPVYAGQSGYVCYLVANKDDVNFGFEQGASLSDPKEMLTGSGKALRHVKIRSLDELDVDYLEELLAEAVTLDQGDR